MITKRSTLTVQRSLTLYVYMLAETSGMCITQLSLGCRPCRLPSAPCS